MKPTKRQRELVAQAAKQAREVIFHLAAAFGRDPTDPQRETLEGLDAIAAGLERAAKAEVWA